MNKIICSLHEVGSKNIIIKNDVCNVQFVYHLTAKAVKVDRNGKVSVAFQKQCNGMIKKYTAAVILPAGYTAAEVANCLRARLEVKA